MIKLFSKQLIKLISAHLLIIISYTASADNGIHTNSERALEIKKQMWHSSDPDFKITEIPQKWVDESAVYIVKTHNLSYRKAPIINELYYDKSFHHRIKLLDKTAIEQYSQFSFAENGIYGGVKYDFYPGFKVIKQTGQEIEISLKDAVKQELEVGNKGYNTYKLAIPNLEIGDIIDFYIAEERVINLYTKLYSFDPLIFQLNEEYPIMKQRISFDVLRRCYINLKSLNGAPKFKLTEEYKGDKNQYTLIDQDRESIKHLRWFFPNRQLPSVKFKVSYASSMMASATPMFLGEPGQLKSNVSNQELEKLIKYIFNVTPYSGVELKKYMKSHFKKEKDYNKLAREAYYAYRNIKYLKYAEYITLSTNEKNYGNEGLSIDDAKTLSYYYRSRSIPHQVIVGVPRDISTIDELVLENELSIILKVNTTSPFYISDCSNVSTLGPISPDLQGTKAFVFDGVTSVLNWTASKTEVPVENPIQNAINMTNEIELVDLTEDKIKMTIKKEITGNQKSYYQQSLMDAYDYLPEEKKKYEMEEDFENFSRSGKKELSQKKTSYLDSRTKSLNDLLLEMTKGDYDLNITKVNNLTVEQTGRYENENDFIFSFNADVEGAIKKVGKNYLIDFGKFLEMQVKLDEEERTREYDVYQPYARKFKYDLSMIIPEGYELQGTQALNYNIENETGAFKSFASIQDNKLIVRTTKIYNLNFIEKENWPLMIEFLDAANQFTQQNILLKKTD